jgi:hypothetical protein
MAQRPVHAPRAERRAAGGPAPLAIMASMGSADRPAHLRGKGCACH